MSEPLQLVAAHVITAMVAREKAPARGRPASGTCCRILTNATPSYSIQPKHAGAIPGMGIAEWSPSESGMCRLNGLTASDQNDRTLRNLRASPLGGDAAI